MNSLYTFVSIDVRKGTDQLTADEWAHMLGFKVTAPALAVACGLGNVEGQHGIPGTPARWVGRAAVEIAVPSLVGSVDGDEGVLRLPLAGSIFAFVKPDVDAVAAAAVTVLRARRDPDDEHRHDTAAKPCELLP